ncbi:hypothetical protein LNO55_09710 [Klebsiella pneumoniae subsp. pneumoniae]|nr:hypothetical protein [Klebsiella pneumoniae subsp. pneumoniae]
MRKTELLAFLQNQTDFFDPDNLSEVFTASWLARRFAMQKKYRQPLSQSAGRSGRAGENQHPAGLFSA